jgi:hypothetical protein
MDGSKRVTFGAFRAFRSLHCQPSDPVSVEGAWVALEPSSATRCLSYPFRYGMLALVFRSVNFHPKALCTVAHVTRMLWRELCISCAPRMVASLAALLTPPPHTHLWAASLVGGKRSTYCSVRVWSMVVAKMVPGSVWRSGSTSTATASSGASHPVKVSRTAPMATRPWKEEARTTMSCLVR